MLPFLGLIEQLLRLINLLLESTPPQLRTAQIVSWWYLTKPLLWPMLPDEGKKVVDGILADLQEKDPEP